MFEMQILILKPEWDAYSLPCLIRKTEWLGTFDDLFYSLPGNSKRFFYLFLSRTPNGTRTHFNALFRNLKGS